MAVPVAAAPAVPAVAGEPASDAAAVPGPPFTVESLTIIARSQDFHQLWQLNETCINYCRHLSAQHIGDRYVADFDLRKSYNIGVVDHDKKGPGFSFDTPAVSGQLQEWSPAQFLCKLHPESIKRLELDQHGGVISLQCESWPNYPDHNLANAMKRLGRPFSSGEVPGVYDLVLTRGDKARFMLRPNHKGPKCRTEVLTPVIEDFRNAGGSKVKGTSQFLQAAHSQSTQGLQ